MAWTLNFSLNTLAETPPAASGKGAARGTTLETVAVSRDSGSGINIEITTKDEITPWVETLSNPIRIIVELPNTAVATSVGPIPVQTNGVKGVRIGTDAQKRTRVVVDLERLCRYELVPRPGNRLILKLDPASPVLAVGRGASGMVGAPVESASFHPAQSPPSQSPSSQASAGTRSQPTVVQPALSPKQVAPRADVATPSQHAARKFRERSEGDLELRAQQPAEPQALSQAVSPPFPPLPAPTLEQSPPRTPQVTWDGKQLSIKSENSTLADILEEVRRRIHSDIEIPAGAAQERVAAELGPGPAREVLTSLLSASDFDYIIQASDRDENAIHSVLLEPRGKSDDGLTAVTVASAPHRTIPGYSGPMHRRPGFMVETGNEQSSTDKSPDSEIAAAEAGSAGDTTASNGRPALSQQAPASPVQDASTGDTNKAGTDQQIVSAGDASTLAAADTSSTSSSMPQMADLQKMYEERRKLQIKQNQAGAAPNAQ